MCEVGVDVCVCVGGGGGEYYATVCVYERLGDMGFIVSVYHVCIYKL